MQKKIAIFCIATNRYGGLEVSLPIVNELNKKNFVQDSIFLIDSSSSSYKGLKSEKIFSKLISVIFERNYVIHRFFFPFYFIIFYIKNFFKSKKVLILAPENSSDIICKYLKKLKNVLFVGHPNTSTLYVNQKTYSDDNDSIYLKFEHSNAIGFPKFYDSWVDLIKSEKNNYIVPKNSVIIFLPSIVDNIYEFDDFKIWFSDVISSIDSSKYSNFNIVIKPHPMLQKDIISYVERQIHKYEKIRIVYLNSQFLLKSASLVITSHSAVILDSLSFEIPTLFYHKFTSMWLARHPEKSNFLDIGATYIDSKIQLMKYLNEKKNIRNDTRKDFLTKINHKNSLIMLLKSKDII